MAKKKRAANEAVEVEENHAEVANGVSYDDDKKKQKKKKKRVKEGRGRRRRRIEGGADGQHSRCWIHIDNAQVSGARHSCIWLQRLGLDLKRAFMMFLSELASQIARAATIFRIDEVVVFDSKSTSADEPEFTLETTGEDSGAAFLIRVLRYLETPQYLRRALFPMHNSLRFVVGVDLVCCLHLMPHIIFGKHEWAPYREGVTLGEKPSNAHGTLVDVGLNKAIVIDKLLEPGVRVTVAMGNNRNLDSGEHTKPYLIQVSSARCISASVMSKMTSSFNSQSGIILALTREEVLCHLGIHHPTHEVAPLPFGSGKVHKIVSSSKPKEEGCIGVIQYVCSKHQFYTKIAHISYDYMIGTSEHGLVVKSSELQIPATCRHLLISFGGLAGLEESVEEDTNLRKRCRDGIRLVLKYCLNQGVGQYEQRRQYLFLFNTSKNQSIATSDQ
ncbi:unnamed protein product [Rhodiola kirilowii]